MKLNSVVAFRIGIRRRIAFGVLVEITRGECVIMRDGKRHVRDIKRVYSANSGKGKKAKEIQWDMQHPPFIPQDQQ